MQSSTPGFIAQLKGRLTKDRYAAATVLVDHCSHLSYIYLQRQLTSEETLNAKHAFESYSRKHRVRVAHYHADNGRFVGNAFMQDVDKQGQTNSFCGINAHFQNGIAEKMIRDLTEATRKQLLHAMARWPAMILSNLWTYPLRAACATMNHLPVSEDGQSPLKKFSCVQVQPSLKTHHLGINLGPSSCHAHNVLLVLSPTTGLASPQFYVHYDDFFETVEKHKALSIAPRWHALAGFGARKRVPMVPRSREKESITDEGAAPVHRSVESPDVLPPIPEVDGTEE
eukprot:7034889-Ditylum_brightwellii.AAC.1